MRGFICHPFGQRDDLYAGQLIFSIECESNLELSWRLGDADIVIISGNPWRMNIAKNFDFRRLKPDHRTINSSTKQQNDKRSLENYFFLHGEILDGDSFEKFQK
jgi:hypothetical protein